LRAEAKLRAAALLLEVTAVRGAPRLPERPAIWPVLLGGAAVLLGGAVVLLEAAMLPVLGAAAVLEAAVPLEAAVLLEAVVLLEAELLALRLATTL
jgi:hypothetical protein